MKYRFFKDSFPVTILYFGFDNYYFKLRELTNCFLLSYNKVRLLNTDKFVVSFEELLERKPNYTEFKLHPNTLLIHINGLYGFFYRFCSKYQRITFLSFLQECFLENNKHLDRKFRFVKENEEAEEEIEDVDTVSTLCGVLPNNIEYFSINEKTYYKAVDVARYLNCSASYNINKYVDDEYMVLWGDLKLYINNNYIWKNCENRWKDNTIFLKDAGLKQLCIATQGNTKLYFDITKSVYNHDPHLEYIKTPSRYRKKVLKAKGCVVGKISNTNIEYLVTTNRVYFKLHQIVKQYSLRINDYTNYNTYLTQWRSLSRNLIDCNIKWKSNLVMVTGEGVYEMLKDVGLKVEAEDFIYNKVHETRLIWENKFKK
ncbi:unknown [Cryptophlebia leucotreta granulovirus]|uniref:Uncharacterized protein n=1 Tax=Cryptophlebia leucotreta granulosis virus TaxID=35254 RepID=Q7T5K3_GVCL|nr:hypothetical protein [Cryptophlebia leucotreta granulovirus]AAQ21685.1 unknown [Cryptophlebia leucotreta granulovirus]